MLKKNLNKILIIVSLVFGALAIIMLVAAGISPKSDFKGMLDSYSMANITFGYKKEVTGMGSVAVYEFSFLNLLTYILIVIGMVAAVLALLGKGGKITSYIAAGLFLVGGILYFCAGKMLVKSEITKLSGLDEYYTIGIGSILGGIFSVLAAAAVLVPTFLKKAE